MRAAAVQSECGRAARSLLVLSSLARPAILVVRALPFLPPSLPRCSSLPPDEARAGLRCTQDSGAAEDSAGPPLDAAPPPSHPAPTAAPSESAIDRAWIGWSTASGGAAQRGASTRTRLKSSTAGSDACSQPLLSPPEQRAATRLDCGHSQTASNATQTSDKQPSRCAARCPTSEHRMHLQARGRKTARSLLTAAVSLCLDHSRSSGSRFERGQ